MLCKARESDSCKENNGLSCGSVENLPAMQAIRVQPLGWEEPLEKGMATYSSILAWGIPWTEEPGRLQSVESQRVGHDWAKIMEASLIRQTRQVSLKTGDLNWNPSGIKSKGRALKQTLHGKGFGCWGNRRAGRRAVVARWMRGKVAWAGNPEGIAGGRQHGQSSSMRGGEVAGEIRQENKLICPGFQVISLADWWRMHRRGWDGESFTGGCWNSPDKRDRGMEG